MTSSAPLWCGASLRCSTSLRQRTARSYLGCGTGAFLMTAPNNASSDLTGIRRWANSCRLRMDVTACGQAAESSSSILCGSVRPPAVTRRSSISRKKGPHRILLFVTLAHDVWQDEQRCISEEQDIVYREPNPPKLSAGEPPPETQWSENISPDPLLLFRYSAVTFNAHRIHFDWPYVTGTEGYPGLVVHGPLTATLNLAAFVQANPLARVRQFSFRGIRPLIAPTPFKVGGHHTRHGFADLWAGDESGISQHASVEFD